MADKADEWLNSFRGNHSNEPIDEPITGPFGDVATAAVQDYRQQIPNQQTGSQAEQILNSFRGKAAPVKPTALDTVLTGADPEKAEKGNQAEQILAMFRGQPKQSPEDRELEDKGREPTGIFSGIIDILSRFQYAEAAMVDEALEGDGGVAAIGNTLVRGAKEFFVPTDRLGFTDLLQKYNPEFAKSNPIATMVAGIAMDIAFDPTTWLSFGVGGAGKAVKVASKAGETLYLTQKGAGEYAKLTKVAQKMFSEEMISSAAKFTWAEEHIAKMAAADPTLMFQKGFQIHVEVPFAGKHLATLLSPETAKSFADSTGLTAVRNAVKIFNNKNALIQSVTGTFRKVSELPPEYVNMANQFLAVAEGAGDEIIKATAKMAKGLNKEGAMKIGRAAHGISDELMRISKEAPMAAGDQLTEDVIEQVQRKWFASEKLGEKEINVYAQMRHGLNEMRQTENMVGLMIGEVAEYFPRYYDNVTRGTGDTGQFYRAKRFSARLSAQKARVFDSIKDAEAAGLNPEWNAVKTFAIRATASRKAVAKKTFDDAVEKLLKTENFSDKTAAIIKQDAREIGDSLHPHFEKEWMNALVNSHDYVINSVFRPAATIFKPGFATFQALSNTVQMMWAGGAVAGLKSGAGVVGNIADAAGTGLGGKYWESMRKTLWNIDPGQAKVDSALILKYLDDPAKLKGSRITTDIGTSYTGEEVAIMIKDMRIAQGTSVLGVPGLKKTAMGELRRTNIIAALSDKTGASEGFLDFMSGAASYWNWPRMVEDMARTNFFMTALKQGHSPHEAMRLVSKGLYDYTGGLSKFEKQWVKRLIPFYSFARFTLPLAADVATTKPGRLVNTARGMKAFFGAWNKIQGGEQLNEAERHSIPGWILEQPSTFSKFGLDGRAHFNTFINWTPLDAVNFLEPGDGERSGIEKTVQKTVLSMLTPVLKLPLEHVMNRNFFTGRVLKDVYNVKDRLGEAGTLWKAVDMVLPDNAKELMGWEVAQDMRTGKQNVYINPYLTHYATGIAPVLNNFIRIFDNNLSTREKAMWTIGNVATYKIDMEQQHMRLVNSRKAAIAEKKRQVKYLYSKGMIGSAEEEQFNLRQLFKDIRDDAEEETEAPRGPGNMPQSLIKP